eukprot:4403194-Karenia_brevis.AAC.1
MLQEALKYSEQVRQAIYDELERRSQLKGFIRYPQHKAKNIIDSRWVLNWKLVDGKRIINARLTAHGFKDAQAQDVKTFAGTASRWGQQMVNAVAAQRAWTLFSADISQAFLRGVSFEQIEHLDGESHRE